MAANTTTTTTIPPPTASNTPQLTPTAMYMYVVIFPPAVGLTPSGASLSVEKKYHHLICMIAEILDVSEAQNTI